MTTRTDVHKQLLVPGYRARLNDGTVETGNLLSVRRKPV